MDIFAGLSTLETESLNLRKGQSENPRLEKEKAFRKTRVKPNWEKKKKK